MKVLWMIIPMLVVTLSFEPSVCIGANTDIASEFDFNKKATSQSLQGKTTENIDQSSSAETYRTYVEGKLHQQRNKFYECILVGVLTIISLFIVLRFITKSPSYSATNVVNASALIFLIFGTILVVILADDREQLTAAVGILGAIAGYIFGTMRKGVGSGTSND